jgi:hypothetical protein
MNLSEAYEKYKANKPTVYACCGHCRKAWVYDLHVIGASIECPVCPERWSLICMEDPATMGCTLDDGESKPPVEDDPGKQARGIHQVRSKT